MATPKTKPKPATKVLAEGPQDREAHPTAPAGMKRAEIRTELAEDHGINMSATRDITLPNLVHLLIQARKRTEEREEAAERIESYPIQVKPSPKPEVSDQSDTCKHGEDPVMCEACEDEMLGGDDEDDQPDPYHSDADALAAVVNEYTEVPGARIVRQSRPAATDEQWQDYADAVAEDQPVSDADILATPEEAGLVPTDTDDEDDWYDEVMTEQDEHRATLPPPLFLGIPGVKDYTFSGHAGTGPSGASRWMNCTASLGMSQKFLRNLSDNQQREFATGSMAARQGTTAHAAAEVEARVMLGEVDANEAEHMLFELAIDPPDGEDYTPEMAQFITEYTDLVKGFVDDGHPVLIEAKVYAAIPLTAPLLLETREQMGLEPGDDDFYVIPGSVDCGVMPTDEEKVITAVDLKYGEGKDVDVEANPQIRIYMLGLLAKFVEDGGDIADLERLDYIIAQPRLGGIKVWTESVDDLLDWQDNVLSPALTAALGLAPSEFSPGEETCQWCPARGGCVALADQRVAAATELFTALDDAEFGDGPALVPADLDNDRLSSLLKQITGLTDLQASLKAEAQRRLYRGDKVPGMVLVNHTPPRAWKDGAQEFFSDEENANLPVWKDPELRTPTQFVKAMAGEFKGKNAKEREAQAQAQYAQFIDVPEKRPVAAFEGDKRSLWQEKAPDQMFDDLGDDE